MITREDLSVALLYCLSANKLFCELCLPIIFEKLSSSFKIAKIDSYQLLQECCKLVDIAVLEKYLPEFWKCVQKDILPGNENQVCESGLSALTEIFKFLSKEESSKDLLFSFYQDVLSCK